MKPNFSGTWILDREKSRLEIPQPDSILFHIEHREPSFRLTRTLVMAGQADTFSIDLNTDGKEITFERSGQTIHSLCRWNEERLRFASRIATKEGEATNVVEYSLSSDGKTLHAEERFRGPRLEYDNVWVLTRE